VDTDAKGLNAHPSVAALREEIRGLMWVCARLRPDKYGDRISAEVSGPGGKDLIPERAADPDRIAQAIMLMIEVPVARTIAAPLARTRIEYSISDADDVADVEGGPILGHSAATGCRLRAPIVPKAERF
jgi:hypothetical protein